MEALNLNGYESANDNKSTNSNFKEIYKKNNVCIHLENSLDLMNIPLKKLLNQNNHFSFGGSYYKKVVKELVEPLEAKKIHHVDPTKKWIKPEINAIIFKVQASTNFGDWVLITGSIPQIGRWAAHHKMTFSEGMWVKEIVDKRKNSADSFQPKTDTSAEYFGRSAESLSQISLKYDSEFEDLNFEFKFIINQNGNDVWESISNRKISIKDNLDILESLINSPDSDTANGGISLVSYYQESMTFNYSQKLKSLVIQCYFNK